MNRSVVDNLGKLLSSYWEQLRLMENRKICKGTNINKGNEFLNIVVHKRSVYEHYLTYYEQTALVDYKTTSSHALAIQHQKWPFQTEHGE